MNNGINCAGLPQNLSQLTWAVELVALDPMNFCLTANGCVQSGGMTTSFKRVSGKILELFRGFYTEPAVQKPMACRLIRDLKLIVDKEIKGNKDPDLLRVVETLAAAVEVEMPLLPNYHALPIQDCQWILTALHLEKELLKSWLWQLNLLRQLDLIESELAGMGRAVVEVRETGKVISEGLVPITFVLNTHLLSALIRYGKPENINCTKVDVNLGFIGKEMADEFREILEEGLIDAADRELLNFVKSVVLMNERSSFVRKDELAAKRTAQCGQDFFPLITKKTDLLNHVSVGENLLKCALRYSLEEKMKEGTAAYSNNYCPKFLGNIEGFLAEYSGAYASKRVAYSFFYNCLFSQKDTFKDRKEFFRYTRLLKEGNELIPNIDKFEGKWIWKPDVEVKLVLPKPQRAKSSKKKNKPKPVQAKAVSKAIAAPEKKKATFLYADYVQRVLDLDASDIDPKRPFHAFGRAVDDYVFEMGVMTLWQGRDTLYSIPGEIVVKGVTYRGVYTYCFEGNKTEKCYHRCFMKKTANEVVQEYLEKGCWNVDFPELKNQHEIKYPDKPSMAQDGSHFVREIRNVIEIEDPRNDISIRLFKVK